MLTKSNNVYRAHRVNKVDLMFTESCSVNRVIQLLLSFSEFTESHSADRIQATCKQLVWNELQVQSSAKDCRVLTVFVVYQNITKFVFRTQVIVVGLTKFVFISK